MARLQCPGCRTVLEIPPAPPGSQFQCPACNRILAMPGARPRPADPPPAPPRRKTPPRPQPRDEEWDEPRPRKPRKKGKQPYASSSRSPGSSMAVYLIAGLGVLAVVGVVVVLLIVMGGSSGSSYPVSKLAKEDFRNMKKIWSGKNVTLINLIDSPSGSYEKVIHDGIMERLDSVSGGNLSGNVNADSCYVVVVTDVGFDELLRVISFLDVIKIEGDTIHAKVKDSEMNTLRQIGESRVTRRR